MFNNVEDVRYNQLHIALLSVKAAHEEADTRVILHCMKSLASTIIIMILLAHYHHFAERPQVFVTMGNIRAFSEKLGPQVSLLLVHTLTGCDAVSFMYGIGKPTVVKVILNHLNLLAGISLSVQLSQQHRIQMESFICLCYGHGELKLLNEVRAHMLFSCSKPEQLPMTSEAFGPHSNRVFHVSRLLEYTDH